LEQTSQKLSEKIERLRHSLLKLAPKLRVTYRQGADEAIDLLSDALATKEAFVYNITRLDQNSTTEAIETSKAAVEALSKAQSALADVIVAMQNS